MAMEEDSGKLTEKMQVDLDVQMQTYAPGRKTPSFRAGSSH
jgi:hypothetical protein